ncbi:PadR family transcriptional regulator [Massilia sp. CF038]|jgi:DNA-binding PadR family transcriptional regulator|uniref:PadR family transcriptional regulator n=1 Tax=Massilia sp. CF038 TaxID=1881045 RepID=UPI000921348A|nr:PadR family transcriptional regulator [Massilia sp. CF038]SHH67324.1 transcriptional regulator, PadR family [Massilia sp. CF038]
MFHFLRHHRVHMHAHGHHHGGGRERGPKMFDAGALRYVVLHLIAQKPRHGYELIKEIEQLAGGGYAPSPGAIYPLLAMLLDLGHIDSSADGNKKLHTITAEGQAFLDENRQLLDAILARLHNPGEGGRGGLRTAMHALKVAVIEQARSGPHDDAKVARIIAILQRAMHDITHLDQDGAR